VPRADLSICSAGRSPASANGSSASGWHSLKNVLIGRQCHGPHQLEARLIEQVAAPHSIFTRLRKGLGTVKVILYPDMGLARLNGERVPVRDACTAANNA
jgi:hypothetical protein